MEKPIPLSHKRPLSPHLSIYRREWTMIYSILHRISGVTLSFGLVGLVVWLFALANSPDFFEFYAGFLASPIGLPILFVGSWSLTYHFANGIRHLVWDIGLGYELRIAERSGHIVAILSLIANLLVWVIGYGVVLAS